MTWILPPEILLRTFGTEVGDHATDGNLDMQLRTVMMCRPIFRGISPSLDEFNPILRNRIRESVELYKRVVRPIMVGGKVYHHTPYTPLLEASPWVVIEYASPDQKRAVISLFRTSEQGDPVYLFRPRGLNLASTYQVWFGNQKQKMEISGSRLLAEGLPIRLENNLQSEMLIFEEQGPSSSARSAF
jgi:hypothetical protein